MTDNIYSTPIVQPTESYPNTISWYKAIESKMVKDFLLNWAEEDKVSIMSVQRMLNSNFDKRLERKTEYDFSVARAVNTIDPKTFIYALDQRRLKHYNILKKHPEKREQAEKWEADYMEYRKKLNV